MGERLGEREVEGATERPFAHARQKDEWSEQEPDGHVAELFALIILLCSICHGCLSHGKHQPDQHQDSHPLGEIHVAVQACAFLC